MTVIANKYRSGKMGAGHANNIDQLNDGVLTHVQTIANTGNWTGIDNFTLFDLTLIKYPNNIVEGKLLLAADKNALGLSFSLAGIPAYFLPAADVDSIVVPIYMCLDYVEMMTAFMQIRSTGFWLFKDSPYGMGSLWLNNEVLLIGETDDITPREYPLSFSYKL